MEKTFNKQNQGNRPVNMRRCPYCGELISPTAVKCRYCGEWLDGKREKQRGTFQEEMRQSTVQPNKGAAIKNTKTNDDNAKTKKLFIGFGIVAVVLSALVVMLTYWYGDTDGDGTHVIDTQETVQTGDEDVNVQNNEIAEYDGEEMAEAPDINNGQTDVERRNGSENPDISQIESMLARWDIAHNDKDAMAFAVMYANTVSYYGSKFTKEQCIANKRELFKRYKEYEQHSYNLNEERIGPGCIKLTFDKHVYYDGNSSVYRGYLVIEKDGNGIWHITRESDTTTDYNLRKRGN